MCGLKKVSQTRRGIVRAVVIFLSINRQHIIQQLGKIITVETNCESYFYVNIGEYTGAILIGLKNHNVVKCRKFKYL